MLRGHVLLVFAFWIATMSPSSALAACLSQLHPIHRLWVTGSWRYK